MQQEQRKRSWYRIRLLDRDGRAKYQTRNEDRVHLRVRGETNRATRMRRRLYAENWVTNLLASIVMMVGRFILRCVGMGGHYLCDRQLTNVAEQREKHEDEDRAPEDHGITIAAAPFSVKPR